MSASVRHASHSVRRIDGRPMLDPQQTKWGKRDEAIGDLHVYLHLAAMPLWACIMLLWNTLLWNTLPLLLLSITQAVVVAGLRQATMTSMYPRLTASAGSWNQQSDHITLLVVVVPAVDTTCPNAAPLFSPRPHPRSQRQGGQ